MDGWAYQQNALVGSCAAEGGVVCPKPRRIGIPVKFYEPLRPSSRLFHINNRQSEACDARAGTELLDIIQMKGNYETDWSRTQVASSPPIFPGSPPSRASNPIIQDENFGNNDGGPPSSTHRSGAYTKVNSAPVRIEGFNCPRSCSISAVA